MHIGRGAAGPYQPPKKNVLPVEEEAEGWIRKEAHVHNVHRIMSGRSGRWQAQPGNLSTWAGPSDEVEAVLFQKRWCNAGPWQYPGVHIPPQGEQPNRFGATSHASLSAVEFNIADAGHSGSGELDSYPVSSTSFPRASSTDGRL